jgi:uncharacterized protein (DUF1778 family)
MSTSTSEANERITARVSPENRALIERAAILSGATNLNSFLSNAVVTEAKRIVEKEEMLRLSQADAEAFVAALDKPVQLNDNLLNAAKRYKKIMTDVGS